MNSQRRPTAANDGRYHTHCTHTYPETRVRLLVHAFPIYSILEKARTISYVLLLFFFYIICIIFVKYIHYTFFSFSRRGPGLALTRPCPALEYEGQGQEWLARPLRARSRASKIGLRAGPARPVESLVSVGKATG